MVQELEEPRARPGPLLEDLTARDVMSSDLMTISEDESVVMAGYLMQQARVHHLPVVRGSTVVGVLDEVTLATCLSRMTWDDLRRPVRGVMHREVVRVRPSTGLRDVAQHLGYSSSGVVVVTEGDALLGVVTSTDVVGAVARSSAAAEGGRRA